VLEFVPLGTEELLFRAGRVITPLDFIIHTVCCASFQELHFIVQALDLAFHFGLFIRYATADVAGVDLARHRADPVREIRRAKHLLPQLCDLATEATPGRTSVSTCLVSVGAEKSETVGRSETVHFPVHS